MTMTPLRVLLIETDADDALMVETELRRGGFNLASARATTEEELRGALQHGPWDIVLADQGIADFDSMRAIEIIRQSSSDLPIIVVSGANGEEIAVEAMRAGANDYVSKSSIRRLLPAVHRELVDAQVRQEQHRLAASLRRVQNRFHATFAEAPIGIVTSTLEGNVMAANRRFAEFVGYETHELVGQPLTLFTPPSDLAVTMDALAIVNRERDRVMRYEKRYCRRDGSIVWGKVTLTSIWSADDELGYCLAMVEDITAEREAAAMLHFKSHLLSCVREAVVATDLGGRITFWNRYAETLYGWTESEVQGRPIAEIIPSPVTSDRLSEAAAEQLGRQESWAGEILRCRRDGTTFHAWISKSPILDSSGNLGGYVCTTRDITEQRDARERLRRREAQLAEAQKIARIGSWEFDPRTGQSLWSDELYTVLGMDRRKPPSLPAVLSLAHPDDHRAVCDFMIRPFRPGEVRMVEFRITRPDGGQRVIHTHGVTELDETESVVRVRGFVQDLTERNETDAKLARRSAQQEAIAGLTRAALRGAGVELLYDLAARAAGRVLDADLAEVIEPSGHDEYRFAATYGAETMAGVRVGLNRDCCVPSVLRSGESLLVDDASGQPHLRCFDPNTRSCAAAVIITGEGRRLGAIAAHSVRPRAFGTDDVDFLRAIANVLAQAVERRRADVELQQRAAQQAALADVTRIAAGGVTQDLLERACNMVTELLHVEYCSVWDLNEEGFLDYRAGRRVFDDGRLLALDGSSQLAFGARSGAPVVVDDYDRETRFDSGKLQAHGIHAGITVAIQGGERALGVITTHTRTPRTFTDGDIRFLQSIGDALSEAMQRDVAQRALVASEELYRSAVEGANETIFTIDPRGIITSLNGAFEKMSGWTREEWLGRCCIDIVAPAERERAEASFKEVLAGRAFGGEFTILACDGSNRLIQTSVTPVFWRGHLAGFHGFAHDLTGHLHRHQRQLVAR